MFNHFLTWYDANIERLKTPGDADEWGYSYRKNRNANNLSCHASGTAVDVNAQKHPNGKRNTVTAAQAKKIRDRLKTTYQGVIKWGGDFSGTPDEMHYEIHGDAAAVKKVADTLRKASVRPSAGTSPAPKANTPRWYSRPLRAGSVGSDVKELQKRLKITADGDFGRETDRRVRYVQHAHGLRVNGVVDAATARAIG